MKALCVRSDPPGAADAAALTGPSCAVAILRPQRALLRGEKERIENHDISNSRYQRIQAEVLVQLIAATKRALYPEANIVDSELECGSCHERHTPALI